MADDTFQFEALTGAVLHDKYRVGRRLGEGGMGAVYLAEHLGIGRAVALKVVRPDLLADPSAAERFVREARAAGGIQHRHVVNVTDFGVDRVAGHDVAYLVMEQLHGETLEAVLEAQPRLPLPLVVDIVAQVSAALAAAHARGVVHRDLKPANIWLTPDVRGGFHVTLLDFGIAKLRDDTFARRDAAPLISVRTHQTDSTATQVGESIGTPAYMSPEQCVGDDVDRRSDLYSLGVVVYQMLAGTLPFRGDTRALLRQHFVAEIPPFPAEAGVPEAVEAVIRRALAKEPAARFATAPAFAAALRAHASGFGESMRRALVMFAERLPELSILGGFFALPGLLATIIGVLGSQLPGLAQPMVWVVVLMAAMLLVTPVAMAGIAAIFGDLRERPFVRIDWRRVARAVIGASDDRSRGDTALYVAWVQTALRRYLATSRATNGNGMKNMLTFVDVFRHGGAPSPPERLEAMALVLPTRAFATMAFAQIGAMLLLPAGAMLAALGLTSALSIPPSRAMPLLALAGGLAFTAVLFLQVFIALVDVMLYDLAYDMTEG
ncbi:serine/threonine-protein kinase [Gemmatimonas groenlandica]|uniref:Serine/threonine protein kinase n=1 Tax=Gemmatimonas groenlandica TaxID=2732249 RepID=A0A6M4IMB4_9BACT|nr:serine/threonine-protein kinase [Gemmatimonas groenlandica]QJR35790.1 serine/threonine protein kinase [Gemmatimonas groenlandica]